VPAWPRPAALSPTSSNGAFRSSVKSATPRFFFGEVLSTVAVVLKLAHRTKQIGDPFGPVTLRMLRAVRREIEIYERNRESLIDYGMQVCARTFIS